MSSLSSLPCPECKKEMASTNLQAVVASRFENCVRRCENCGIGASNAANPSGVSFIYRDPRMNVPEQCRDGVLDTLSRAMNVRNRDSKRVKFGFSTSEDAVTWVVFTYLLRSGRLVPALREAQLVNATMREPHATLLLWGVPIDSRPQGITVREELESICKRLGEKPRSYSEPDVIIDLGGDGLLFIEVKYRSGNDNKPINYAGWNLYQSAPLMDWNPTALKASGCYELARNWCLLRSLAGGRPAALVNLGFRALFDGPEGSRLDRFVESLGKSSLHFHKLTWEQLLRNELSSAPEWFCGYCKHRRLVA